MGRADCARFASTTPVASGGRGLLRTHGETELLAMTVPVDLSPFGARAPAPFVRFVLALTRSLPANWLGFRVSTPFRRLAIDWLGELPVDTELWGARMRLYPVRNSCEK